MRTLRLFLAALSLCMVRPPALSPQEPVRWDMRGPASPRAPGTTDDSLVICFRSGWNLVSLPITVPDRHVTSVFPEAAWPYVFTYLSGAGYLARNALEYGEGYWAKFIGTGSVTLRGKLRDIDTIPLAGGWAMIGTISYPVPVDSIIPPGSFLYIFGPHGPSCPIPPGPGPWLPVDTLWPGLAYWIKTPGPVQLILKRPGN